MMDRFSIVLQWIENRENTSVCVTNRVTEIINEKDVAFQYINTKHNQAARNETNGMSRGMSAKE